MKDLFNQLDNDPMLVQLIMAINRFQGSTAKELKKLFFLSGNKIYYYLNKLEEKNMVRVEEENVKRNFLQKKYFTRTDFLNQEEFLQEFRSAKNKEYMILKLNFISTILKRQIERIQNMNQVDFEKMIAETIDFASFYTFPKQISEKIKQKYQELQNLMLKEVYEVFGSDIGSRIAKTTVIGFSGFIPII